MILIISETDQIIGADEEFLEDKGLDYIKESFPSMSVFLLQSENGSFNFEYNDKEYNVTKYPIIMDNTNANIYLFSAQNQINTITNSSNKSLEQNQNIENESEISLETSQANFAPVSNEHDNLILSQNDEPTLNNELELGLDLSDNIQSSSNEAESNLSQNDEPTLNNELELDLGLSNNQPNIENSSNELNLGLDLGIEPTTPTNIDVSITKEEIKKDLQQASNDLGIDNDTLEEFFRDFKQQLRDEKDIFFKAIQNQDYETLHKSAHKLKGVALNLRLSKFGELLKNSDDLAKNQTNINEIKKIIENIYKVIDEDDENTQKSSITIETNLSLDDKNILLKSILDFLNDIKNKDINTIKKEILNAYNIIPIKEFKEVENINNTAEITSFVENLIENIKKEIK